MPPVPAAVMMCDSANDVTEMSERENRVVLRCRPYATYAQPPRHLYRNDQAEEVTHWVSGVVAWDMEDPC